MKRVMVVACIFLAGCGPKKLTESGRIRVQGTLRDGYLQLEFRKADEALRIAESVLDELAECRSVADLEKEALALKKASELDTAMRAADQAIQAGELERARELLRELKKKHPGDRGVRDNLAEIEKRIAEARRALKKAEKEGP